MAESLRPAFRGGWPALRIRPTRFVPSAIFATAALLVRFFATCVSGDKEPANDPTNRRDRGVFLEPVEPNIERYTTKPRNDEPRNAPRLFCVERRQPGGDVDRRSAF